MSFLTLRVRVLAWSWLVSFLWLVPAAQGGSLRPSRSDKCTTVIVGKLATSDGSVLLAHNEDWGEFEVPLQWRDRERHQPGATLKLNDGLVLEQVLETYAYLKPAAICNGINEFQVMITDNSGSCREDMAPRITGIDMQALVTVALQRARTAREAVSIMGQLIDRFGYRCIDGPGGDIFSVADPSEGWWMEVTTSGPWVARRVPDDSVVVIANRFRIESVDPTDNRNFLASSNLVSHAIAQGWYDPRQGPFGFAKAYSGHRPESRKREARGYALLGGLVAHAEDPPLATVSNRKLSPRDLMAFLRDHGETMPPAGLPSESAPSPHRFSERPICTLYTDASTVAHLRGWLPTPVTGVLWVAVGTPCSSVFTPYYTGAPGIPRAYAGVTESYDSRNAYWVFNALENLVDRHYWRRGPALGSKAKTGDIAVIDLVRRHWRQLEDEAFRMQPVVEKTALELVANDPDLARSLLVRYSRVLASESLEDATELLTELRSRLER